MLIKQRSVGAQDTKIAWLSALIIWDCRTIDKLEIVLWFIISKIFPTGNSRPYAIAWRVSISNRNRNSNKKSDREQAISSLADALRCVLMGSQLAGVQLGQNQHKNPYVMGWWFQRIALDRVESDRLGSDSIGTVRPANVEAYCNCNALNIDESDR